MQVADGHVRTFLVHWKVDSRAARQVLDVAVASVFARRHGTRRLVRDALAFTFPRREWVPAPRQAGGAVRRSGTGTSWRDGPIALELAMR
jgi:hypothetical protein